MFDHSKKKKTKTKVCSKKYLIFCQQYYIVISKVTVVVILNLNCVFNQIILSLTINIIKY